jgi:hypothetical protein
MSGSSLQLFAVFDRQFQKVMRVKEGLDDGPGVAKPGLIMGNLEFVASALANNFQEPAVQRVAGQQFLQRFADFLRHILETIDFERLMVETVEAILHRPMSFDLCQQFLQFGKRCLMLRSKSSAFKRCSPSNTNSIEPPESMLGACSGNIGTA